MNNTNRVKRFVNIIKNTVDTTPQLISCKEDIKTLCSMLTDWARGNYKHISNNCGCVHWICYISY